MLDNYLEKYIDDLYDKQNNTPCIEQRGLFTKKQYYSLLKPVIDLIKNNKDLSLNELRLELYKQSNIEKNIDELLVKKELTPGIVLGFGTNNYQETIIAGNRQEVIMKNDILIPAIEEMTEDTIFDLASVTKLFTSISIIKLLEYNLIDLSDEVIKYVPQFKNLKGVTIFDLISFGIPLKTKRRIDSVENKDEAEKILFDIEIDNESNNLKPYTDMGAMILKYIIEAVSGMEYYEFLNEVVLKRTNMNNTYVNVPEIKIPLVANGNYDIKLTKDSDIMNIQNVKGIAYDKKAQVMGQKYGNLSGHAGLFSSVPDMVNLGKSLINYELLPKNLLEMIAQNRTGKIYYEDGIEKYIQYYGFLTYSKNPNLSNNELFEGTSGMSLASAGWSGTQITLDPINKMYFFMASNRSHHRITSIDESRKKDIIIDKYGKKSIKLPNDKEIIDTTRYSWERGSLIVKPIIKLTIQYKMLEDFFNINREKDQEKVVKKIKVL